MKKFLAVLLALIMALGTLATMSTAYAEDGAAQEDGKLYDSLGKLTVDEISTGPWAGLSSNALKIVPPGVTMSGLYPEKVYAKYNESLGCYEVVKKVATHRALTQVVEKGYIGVTFNYAPLTTAGSAAAKENWYVWQFIKPGDRLYLKNIDLENKKLNITGTFGTTGYKTDSYIDVVTVRDRYTNVTPYSNKSIVAQGDSITVGGGWTTTWGDYFSTTVINSGFGGDTSWASLASRYDTYVASFKPEIVIVSFGINDAFSAAPSEELMEKYKNALRAIYDKNTANGATTVFMNANVIKISSIQNGGVFDKGDYSAFGGEEAYLDKFEACMTEVAEEKGCVLIDIYSMWKEEGLSPEHLVDNCHPKDYGYDRNWVVQKEALIKNMKAICGDDIRVLKGTTVKHAVDGMPDCTVTVKDAAGKVVTDTAAVLEDGYTVSYARGDEDLGSFVVKTFEDITLGDVNGDTKINSLDAAMVLKFDADLVALSDKEMAAADVNGDGKVNSLDAAMILKFDAELIDKFPASK